MPRDVPPDIDPSKPSVARIYDAGLGGKDNYEVDRAVLRKLLDLDPDAMTVAQDNRAWLSRITRFLAGEVGISQFLDLGSGLPTAENTHQVAQRFNRDARVVCADNDPVVNAHGRALLVENEQTRFTGADLMRPRAVLSDPLINRFLDFREPVALFQIGTLHHQPDADEIREVMRIYVEALAPGSYVALSHFYNPGGADGLVAEEAERTMVDGPMGSGYFRGRDEIASFFPPELEVLEPGLALPSHWWPDGPAEGESLTIARRLFLAGLARKP